MPTVVSAGSESAVTLDRVMVETPRLRGVSAFDTPASLDVIDLREESATAGTNLSERLARVPGLLARDRQNYAQDTQLSIRGFGARSTFGVRGVRLYADGIPATMPDGQGQLSHFSLAASDRVEIIRGPFSALYGNSSGGVVQLFSAAGQEPDELTFRATAASDDTYAAAARWLGRQGRVGFNLAASIFDTGGYREHSAARRASANARFDIDLGGDANLTLVLNHLDLPKAQDPLGLTRAQVRQDPRQATAVAEQFNTRKTVRQDQGGAVYTQGFGGGHELKLVGYAGRREVEQFLALPVGAQANPLNSGGVIDLDSDYGGLDARWSWQGQLAGRPFEWTLGGNAERMRQHRRGYENFVGTALGVRGALRRDERNQVENVDQFAQAWWQLAPHWSLLAGVRHSEVRFRSDDNYTSAPNPDDSGRVRYTETTPVAGLMFRANDQLRLYLSAGRGFETPTFNELSYRTDGGAGLAFDLTPAVSRNVELGMKWRNSTGAVWEAALFRADTDDELAVARNVGGRSTYRNVGRARRQGFETSYETALGEDWRLQLAYTRLMAEFRDDFLICNRAGCTVPDTLVAAGTRIPGTARDQFFGRLQWQVRDWEAAMEAVAMSDVSVNDIGSESSPGYALLHMEVSRRWRLGAGSLRGFARIDNALDQRYIGSVIVNEGNSRFYEPGPDRTFLIGAEWKSAHH
ncbi:TonB-dependent receptor family protein [Pseudoxanthomonas sp. UTMC 1351]|uniref:TonB-dependent receptor family protein n=1 Tax=Pseudoxanthomonas sp. UTMC 1351 TaxID=2695853 RepID=UPI0034CFFD24